MSVIELDSKGRITLPKAMRETVGIRKKVLAINAGAHLMIIPLPSTPIQALDGVLSMKRPFSEIRVAAEELAVEEAKEGGDAR